MAERIASQVAFLITTIARPACVQRLVHSIKVYHPDCPIYVIEQVEDDRTVEDFCRNEAVHHRRIPFDAGLSAARNVGLDLLPTPYFVLCDDDSVLTRALDLATAVRVLEDHPDVLMIGGELDEPHKPTQVRDSVLFHKARNIAIDRTARGVLIISSAFAGSPVERYGEHCFIYCDMVANWGLCALERFRAHKIGWDERFKIGGEHLDFFLEVKVRHPHLKIMYWDAFRCLHEPERTDQYNALRYRLDWTADFRAKWSLDFQYQVGGALRSFDETFRTGRVPDPARRASQEMVDILQDALTRERDLNARLKTRLERLQNLRKRDGAPPERPKDVSPVGAPAKPIPRELNGFIEKFGRYFDRAEGPSPFRHLGPKLILAATSRSGSTLACRLLTNYGLGIDEFFQPSQLARFGASEDRDFHGFVERLARQYAPQRAFGVKGTYQTLAPLFRFGEFPAHIGEWRFIFLRRRNMVAQAVSLAIAEATGAWRSDMTGTVAPENLSYRRETIDNNIASLNLTNRRWSDFFKTFGITPLEIWFEDLLARPDAVIGSVAQHAGLDRSTTSNEATFFDSGSLQSQSSEVNAAWEARYRAETGRGAKPLSAPAIAAPPPKRIHILHIPKTGGTAVKTAISDPPAHVVLHSHATRLADIPPGERVVFTVRHPFSRFVSAFWSRYRRGRPRYDIPWSEAEQTAFDRFETPNALAEGLSNPLLRDEAEDAMHGISHINRPLSHWITQEGLEQRRQDICYIARQETLKRDFMVMKRLVALPRAAALPTDAVAAHKMPSSLNTTLSDTAVAGLRRWYRDDIKLYQTCTQIRRDILNQMASQDSDASPVAP